MVCLNNTGQVEVLKLLLPGSYWPLEFQQLGDSVAVQLHAAGRQWLVVLQKGKSELGGLPASPVYLDDQQRQVADAAVNLIMAAGGFVDHSDRLSQSQKPALDRLSLKRTQ
jgi:hypothetical protein